MVTISFLSAFYNCVIVLLSMETKHITTEIAKHIVTTKHCVLLQVWFV